MQANKLITYSTQIQIFLFEICCPVYLDLRGAWRKQQNEELHEFYCSPDIVLMVMSRKMRLVGRAARRERREICTAFWYVQLKK
jgi:hypothetical protein